MTKRRLINKKAYEELELLQKLAKDFNNNYFRVSINGFPDLTERFELSHYIDGEFKASIVGEDYTTMSKMVIEYLSKL